MKPIKSKVLGFLFLVFLVFTAQITVGQYQSYLPCLENYKSFGREVDMEYVENNFLDELEILIQAGERDLAMDVICGAAAMGVSDAELTLGALCAEGLEKWKIDKDEKQARYWYKRAANKGNSQAKYELCKLYLTARGGPRDINQALTLLKSAAEENNSEAQLMLSKMLAAGDYVAKDYDEALLWAQRAAANGNEEAMEGVKLLKEYLGKD